MEEKNIPLLDCPVDFLVGDATGRLLNEYGRFPCQIKCGVFAFMVQGNAQATVNITRHEVHKDDFIFIAPDSFLLIHEFSNDALVYYVLFSSEFLAKNVYGNKLSLENLQIRNPIVPIKADNAEVFKDMYRILQKAGNTQPPCIDSERMLHVFNLLQVSFTAHAKTIQESNPVLPQDRKSEIYQNYIRLVLDHYTEWHHVSQYAKAMRITLPHLCTTIKNVSKKTAGDIINDAILMNAKAQLKITNLQIKEIAMSLGFDNVAFFNRFFKKHTGFTPKAYRVNT